MTIRGIRGATTICKDEEEFILGATKELLEAILEANSGLLPEDIASIIFTVTDDISSSFPAIAARQMGWANVPMVCAREIPVIEGLIMCIRVLVHWNTNHAQSDIRHIYLHDAVILRPDLIEKNNQKFK